jgi:hypothetical protein
MKRKNETEQERWHRVKRERVIHEIAETISGWVITWVFMIAVGSAVMCVVLWLVEKIFGWRLVITHV